MVDRLLRVHIQSQRAFGPRWTLSYNTSWITKVCMHFATHYYLTYVAVMHILQARRSNLADPSMQRAQPRCLQHGLPAQRNRLRVLTCWQPSHSSVQVNTKMKAEQRKIVMLLVNTPTHRSVSGVRVDSPGQHRRAAHILCIGSVCNDATSTCTETR